MSVRHLIREMHDFVLQPVSIWCDAGEWMRGPVTEVIEESDCRACLEELHSDGSRARRRLEDLRRAQHPNWTAWASAQSNPATSPSTEPRLTPDD